MHAPQPLAGIRLHSHAFRLRERDARDSLEGRGTPGLGLCRQGGNKVSEPSPCARHDDTTAPTVI